MDYEAKRAEILKSVQADLDALDAESILLIETSTSRMGKLEEEIRNDVLQHGASVKGGRLYAVFNRGRVSWDTKELDHYANMHPEITAFRKQGKPSVSLRSIQDPTKRSGESRGAE